MLRILGAIFVGGAAGVACGGIVFSFAHAFFKVPFFESFIFVFGNVFIIGAVCGVYQEWNNYWKQLK